MASSTLTFLSLYALSPFSLLCSQDLQSAVCTNLPSLQSASRSSSSPTGLNPHPYQPNFRPSSSASLARLALSRNRGGSPHPLSRIGELVYMRRVALVA